MIPALLIYYERTIKMKKIICVAIAALMLSAAVLSGCTSANVKKNDSSAASSKADSNNTSSDNDSPNTNGGDNGGDNSGDNGGGSDNEGTTSAVDVSFDDLPEWKQAYIDYIGKNINKTAYKTGYFIHLDNDEIPEIVLYPLYGAAAAHLLWVDSENTVHDEMLLAHFNEATHQQKNGKLFCNSYNSNVGGVLVYEKDGDSCNRVLEATFSNTGNFPSYYNNYQNGIVGKASLLKVNGNVVSSDDEFFELIKDEYDFTSDECVDVTSTMQFQVGIADMAIAYYET